MRERKREREKERKREREKERNEKKQSEFHVKTIRLSGNEIAPPLPPAAPPAAAAAAAVAAPKKSINQTNLPFVQCDNLITTKRYPFTYHGMDMT